MSGFGAAADDYVSLGPFRMVTIEQEFFDCIKVLSHWSKSNRKTATRVFLNPPAAVASYLKG